MGKVIAIDFKQRRRAHARQDRLPGPAVEVAALAACLACLYGPLLYWSAWLAPARRQEGSHGRAP